MAVSYIDTQKIKDISQNIISEANKYDVIINKLFKRLIEMPFVTKEWIGNRAEEYIDYVSLDKSEFISFGEKLRDLGKRISEDSDIMEDKIEYAKNVEKK